ncbi:MAG: hypothetical protein KGK34_00235 [Chloroflexota bacterium]|nr:hypothetical protein [Chloroflexota bacterium]
MSSVVHVVDRFGGGERVGCPLQGRDVDVDECQGCPRLKEIDLGADVPYVACDPPMPRWWLPELAA